VSVARIIGPIFSDTINSHQYVLHTLQNDGTIINQILCIDSRVVMVTEVQAQDCGLLVCPILTHAIFACQACYRIKMTLR